MKKILLLFSLLTVVFTCNKKENTLLTTNVISNEDIFSTDEFSESDFNILFVGNSLTYTNNLPELVKQIAQEKGITLGIKTIAKPNYAIVDHWAEGEVQKYIESKNFDYVIIQQGPSSQQEGRNMLIEGGKKYVELCATNNAKLCYFMVWPSLTYYHTFDGVIKNHEDAAIINNALLCPVGLIWKDHFDATNTFDYYGSDGFHPSLLGSQIAANVIVATLF
ncbi:MAG TPA: hypothetical protein VKN14_14850 [Flavobacteriaceae bacterium]|nr:hypothetical protein [Flavobacteriaceae bacterium]